jgi:hypothetical protein
MSKCAKQACPSKEELTFLPDDASYRQAVEEFDFLWNTSSGQSQVRMDELIELIECYERNLNPLRST